MPFAIPSPYTILTNTTLEAYNPSHDFEGLIKYASPLVQVDTYRQLILDLQSNVPFAVDLTGLDKLKLFCIKSRDPVDFSFKSIQVAIVSEDQVTTETTPIYTGMPSTFLLHIFAAGEQASHLYLKSPVNTTCEVSVGGMRPPAQMLGI